MQVQGQGQRSYFRPLTLEAVAVLQSALISAMCCSAASSLSCQAGSHLSNYESSAMAPAFIQKSTFTYHNLRPQTDNWQGLTPDAKMISSFETTQEDLLDLVTQATSIVLPQNDAEVSLTKVILKLAAFRDSTELIQYIRSWQYIPSYLLPTSSGQMAFSRAHLT